MYSASTAREKQSATMRKRKQPVISSDVEESANCSFCFQVPAALSVQMPISYRKKRESALYCLTCYYTTSVVRQDASKFVSIHSKEQLEAQLPPMQQLFSEAYVDLQKSLQEESSLAFSKQKVDPLALLHGGGMAPRRMTQRTPKLSPEKKKAGDMGDGGFLRSVPLPAKILKTQQEQARLQREQIERMNQAAAAATKVSESSNVYKRRKSSRQSIWNLAMDPSKVAEAETSDKLEVYIPACTCGSKNVEAVGNITSRNQDLKKGETWGMKDRGEDVVGRYRCNQCGRMWNEVE